MAKTTLEETKDNKYFPLLMLLFFSSTIALAVWSGAFFMGIFPKIVHIITGSFIVFGVYGLNRYTDKEDALNDTNKIAFFSQRKVFLYLSILLLTISIVWLIADKSLTAFHIICIYSGIAYSVPLFPYISKGKTLIFIRFKDVVFLKSLLVSIILGTCFFSLYVTDPRIKVSQIEVIILMISSTLSMFINTVFCDIRDIAGDKGAGVRTIPVVFNIKNTLIYSMLLPSLIWLGVCSCFFVQALLPMKIFVFMLFIIAYPVLYISLYFSKKLPEKSVFLIADSCLPLFAIGLVILRLF